MNKPAPATLDQAVYQSSGRLTWRMSMTIPRSLLDIVGAAWPQDLEH
jgi:hypothetical protein